ncbi:TonB-dependent receptor [Bryobacter aggregatus]|uniref:TonB-dependent receptor n=1 Tax=Bryobacter aggregatus TaxID=360054 RepID=UPI001EE1F403|nr:TonB-dependent receptor [Bryobacter aggregatus]
MRWIVQLLIISLGLCSLASAQDARGTILGRVTDTTGANIVAAPVRALNPSTGVTLTATTNADGNYLLPYLLPGKYTVTVEMTGFKKAVQNQVEVRVGDQVELNIVLTLGDVKETLEVSAATPLLNTADSSLGQVVDERRITELPSFAGNAMDMVHLAPGTVNGTNLRLRKAPFNSAPSAFSTDGSGNNQNEFAIDGISNTYSDGTAPRVAFSPPQFSLSEFKIQTTPYDASSGHTMGSVVNVSTKGGTNDLHGELHWWFRNKAFDTPTIFQNRSGQKPAQYTDNRYGFSAGSQIVIPKIYNGKNKTFWFFGYEGNKFQDPSNQAVSTVPTAKVRNGDLSDYLALGANYQVYDPATTVRQANGTFTRTPFAGNFIPASRISPISQAIMKAWPLPNQNGTADFRNNFFRSSKALENYWTTIGRIDHTFSEKHRVFVRWQRDYWQEDKNRFLSANDNITGVILNRINRGIAFDDVYVFSPSFLMNFRYGLTQQEFPERRVSKGFDLASLGFSSALTSLIPKDLATFPRVNVNPYTVLSNWESGDGVTASLTHHFNLNFTKLIGQHNMHFGVDYRVYRENRNRYMNDVSPNLNFDAEYTKASNTAGNPQLGGEIASFLLGVPAGNMNRTASYAEQDKYWGFYFQDDYKLSKRLTLNLGLRYEYETPMTERFDRAVEQFAFGVSNPIEAQAKANYARSPFPDFPVDRFRVLGGLTFANVGGNPRTYYNAPRTNFQPRIGLAYQLTPKTILRAGYGIFTGSIGVNYTNTVQTGFSQSTPIRASLDTGLTPYATLANPFPGGLLAPAGSSNGLRTNLGQGIEVFDRDRKAPYAQRWSLGFQRELLQKFVLEMSYVGNRATRLSIYRDLNAIPNQYLSTSPTRDDKTNAYLNENVANPFQGLDSVSGGFITRGQILRPYPQFTISGATQSNNYSINQLQPIGYSWYHSLQSRLERRFAQGLTVQLSHTWSKAMQATEFLNPGDPGPSEVVSDLNRTHAWRASGILEIPFGKGRKFGGNANWLVNGVAGGWQLNGVWQNQSGGPLGFGNRIFNGDLKKILLPDDQRSVDRWLNYDAVAKGGYGFVVPSGSQLVNNVRTFPLRFSGITGPGQSRWDFSAIKNFRLGERFVTQFRAEVFNAMNHPNLANPNTDPTSTSFGVITGQDSPRSWQFALKISF